MAEVPSEEELLNAVGKMRNGIAGGESGILPEMAKAACCEEVFLSKLLDLVKGVCTPSAWCDSILVPIPKKGDLSNCDNCRGISMLDVVGKVVARILQERFQKLAEDELPESQCGFWTGGSCKDIIFSSHGSTSSKPSSLSLTSKRLTTLSPDGQCSWLWRSSVCQSRQFN